MNPKDYLRASDGNGEAVRAVVVEERQVGDMLINVDSVLNWPHKGIATSGEVDVTTGVMNPATVSVFYYTLSGSMIHIDEFAPGYYDIGNRENEMIVIKPTTPWANAVEESIGEGGATIHIGDTPPPDAEPGDLWGDTSDSSLNPIVVAVGSLLMPIGTIITNKVNSANPAEYLGFGTWEPVEGYVIAGYKEGDPDFGTIGATVGAKSHTHGSSGLGVPYALDGSQSWLFRSNMAGLPTIVASNRQSNVTWSGGGGMVISTFMPVHGETDPSDSLQPTLVAYVWERVA